jgi:sugar phosphate isomerase/epimerase
MNNHALVSLHDLHRDSDQIDAALTQNGIKLAAIGSYIAAEDLDSAKRLAAVAQRLKCRIVRVLIPTYRNEADVKFLIDRQRHAWRDLGALGEDSGVVFCLELHDGTIAPSASAAMRILENTSITGSGVIFDAANTVVEGNESMSLAISVLRGRIEHVHVKQRRVRRLAKAIGSSLVAWDITPLDQDGDVPWSEIIRLLKSSGYKGWYSIEDFTGIDKGDARLMANSAWMRNKLVKDDDR